MCNLAIVILASFCVMLGCGTRNDPRVTARSYAREDIPCTNDSDCCTVVDSCLSQTYVVGVADQDAVTRLVAEANRLGTAGCNFCIAPSVAVSCAPTGFCVGAIDACGSPVAHCGNGGRQDGGACTAQPLNVSRPPTHGQTILGCGPKS
jgi:hypothetical protein